MKTLLSGKRKQKTLLRDSSKTLQNMKATKLVKHLLQQVLSYNFISEQIKTDSERGIFRASFI